jgi:chromosome segregation ATPase
MKEGLKGIKNFEDEVSYYRFYLKECEAENIKLIEKIDQLRAGKLELEKRLEFAEEQAEQYKEALEEISRQYENTSVNRALEIAKEALN